MIEPLCASPIHTAILLIHCAATGACPLCMLSNTARKPRQCTEDCERGRLVRQQLRVISLRCERGGYTENDLITFIFRLGFSRRVCFAIAPTRVINVFFPPPPFLLQRGV